MKAVKTVWFFSAVLLAALSGTGAEERSISLFESPTDLSPQGKIDRLVFGLEADQVESFALTTHPLNREAGFV